MTTLYGFKFLSPDGATERDGERFYYNLPLCGEKWSEITWAPDLAVPDGRDCGPGRLHVMKRLSNDYWFRLPDTWWPWWARSEGEVVGQSSKKWAAHGVRLRRITPDMFHRMIRLGFCQASFLANANLADANLRGANLENTNLQDANLRGANLENTNLQDANLQGANLQGANLRGANLYGANLYNAIFNGTYILDTIFPIGFDPKAAGMILVE